MLKSSAKIASFSQFKLHLIGNMQHDTFVLSVLSHTGNYAHGKFKILQSSIVLNVILYIETGLSEKKKCY